MVDEYETHIGLRDARFTPDGFFLNGKHLKLRGLNRHQTFPFVGPAMPARVQRRDAWIVRKELKCNGDYVCLDRGEASDSIEPDSASV